MPDHGPEIGVSIKGDLLADPAAVRDIAQAADELGYDSIWVSEHTAIPVTHTSRYPFSADGSAPFRPDTAWSHATVALGFVAGITSRVRLGTSIIPVLTRDPLSLAKEAATLHALSGGRFDLGLGAGWLREEASALGRPADHPAGRLTEALEILRKAWAPGPFSYAGRYWTVPEVHVNPKPPGGAVPIWIGGAGPMALDATVAHAVGNVVVGGPEAVSRIGTALRERRPDLRLCASTGAVEFTDDEVGDRVRELHLAGADVVMARCSGDPTAERVAAVTARLSWFATEVRPELAEVPVEGGRR